MVFVTHDELQIRSFHIFLGVGTGRPFAILPFPDRCNEIRIYLTGVVQC